MNILVFVAQSRSIPESIQAIMGIAPAGHDLTFVWDRRGSAREHDWGSITEKYQRARRLCLEGSYDAMLSFDDDTMPPADILPRLIALDADIAYGLMVWRQRPNHWTAAYDLGPEDAHHVSWSQRPDWRERFGTVIPVVGCGLMGTLTYRHVLEVCDYELRGWRGPDWYHAFDAREAGFRQLCDTRIHIGHIDPANDVIWWPDGGAQHYCSTAYLGQEVRT